MKKLTIFFGVFASISVTAAQAQNLIFFNQTDVSGGNTVGIGALTITQSGIDNSIGTFSAPSSVKGRLGELRISQVGDNNATNFSVFATNSSSTSGDRKLDIDIRGDRNKIDLVYGSSTNPHMRPEIITSVFGDDNTIDNDIFSGTLSGEKFYSVEISGNKNSITTATSGLVTSVHHIHYELIGDNNALSVNLTSTEISNDIFLSALIDGNNNDWTLTSSLSSGRMEVYQGGSNVTGTISQSGSGVDSNAKMLMKINKIGTDPFTVNTTASNDSEANIDLVALGGGSFTLNQGPGSRIFAKHVIAAGGSATINQ